MLIDSLVETVSKYLNPVGNKSVTNNSS